MSRARLLAMLLLGGGALDAQAPRSLRSAPDTTEEGRRLRCTWQTREDVEVTLEGARGDSASGEYVARVARAIDDLFGVADSVGLPQQAILEARLDPGGAVTVREGSRSPSFDTAAVATARLALKVEPPGSASPQLDGATLVIHVGRRASSPADTLVARFRHCPARAARRGPEPEFPDELREAGVEGRVMAEFVVDTAGLADMRTFRVVNSRQAEPAFVESVRRVLPRMRFVPARRDGASVRQLVRQPFVFRLED